MRARDNDGVIARADKPDFISPPTEVVIAAQTKQLFRGRLDVAHFVEVWYEVPDGVPPRDVVLPEAHFDISHLGVYRQRWEVPCYPGSRFWIPHGDFRVAAVVPVQTSYNRNGVVVPQGGEWRLRMVESPHPVSQPEDGTPVSRVFSSTGIITTSVDMFPGRFARFVAAVSTGGSTIEWMRGLSVINTYSAISGIDDDYRVRPNTYARVSPTVALSVSAWGLA